MAWLLWALGGLLMVDNIRAQPHENEGRRGYGLILLGMILFWPLVVLWGLIPDPYSKRGE